MAVWVLAPVAFHNLPASILKHKAETTDELRRQKSNACCCSWDTVPRFTQFLPMLKQSQIAEILFFYYWEPCVTSIYSNVVVSLGYIFLAL